MQALAIGRNWRASFACSLVIDVREAPRTTLPGAVMVAHPQSGIEGWRRAGLPVNPA